MMSKTLSRKMNAVMRHMSMDMCMCRCAPFTGFTVLFVSFYV